MLILPLTIVTNHPKREVQTSFSEITNAALTTPKVAATIDRSSKRKPAMMPTAARKCR